MIVLDTNVVSELMRATRADSVVQWIESRPTASLCTTVTTQAEMLLGVMLLPKGKRRDALEEVLRVIFDIRFAGRVLAFDGDAARAYARIVAARRRSGHPISQSDAEIAAIARSTSCELATRNVRDFEGLGIELHNPWEG